MRVGLLIVAAGLFLAGGCAGYRVGPTNPELTAGRSVQVNFFENQTIDPPRLVDAVAHALRKGIQRDGSYRLNTQGDGDVVLDGTILKYDRVGLSFEPTDTLTPREYRVFLIARVKATDRSTGRVVLDREVRGRTTVLPGTDLPGAERQALPLLADDFANNVVALLAEGSW